MYGYKAASIEFNGKSITVDLTMTGDWKARSSYDYNELCDLPGLDLAIGKALESDDSVGQNKKKTVTVTVF